MAAVIGHSRGLRPEDIHALTQLVDGVAHRGPDGVGYLLGSEVGARLSIHAPAYASNLRFALGHRRLAIQDLTESGAQPMLSPRTGSSLVYNGEVYNVQEVRERLTAEGVSFHGSSDTEVLLHGWDHWGPAVLDQLEGMWAFVLYDAARDRFYACRDRFGQKQLYFGVLPSGALALSSQISPLVQAGASRGVRDEAIWDFLRFGLADHESETFYAGIQQVMPGELLELQNPGDIRRRRYYKLSPEACGGSPGEIALALRDSVQEHLVSDVPIGAFLSAGLDSSSVVYWADAALSCIPAGGRAGNMQTFTRVYPEREVEEAGVAALLPRLANVDAVSLVGDHNTLVRDLWDLVRIQETPFHTSAIHASYDLFRTISNEYGLKVMLSGDGGDELFGGYVRTYASVALRDRLRGGAAPPKDLDLGGTPMKAWASIMAKLLYRSLPQQLQALTARRRLGAAAVMSREFRLAFPDRERTFLEQRFHGSLKDRLLSDTTSFNLPHLLRHLDRNSMAFGIEARAPFLGRRVVEAAFAGQHAYIQGNVGKIRLRQAMSQALPPEIIGRVTKTGFGADEQYWFAPVVRELAGGGAGAGYIDLPAFHSSLGAFGGARLQQSWLAASVLMWLEKDQTAL